MQEGRKWYLRPYYIKRLEPYYIKRLEPYYIISDWNMLFALNDTFYTIFS